MRECGGVAAGWLVPHGHGQVLARRTVICTGEDMGWTAEWPELDIQIGANTLLLDAEAQNALDENTRIFLEWRVKNGLSLEDAAHALGMTPRTMSAYGTGRRPVPRYIALACIGWETRRLRRTSRKIARIEKTVPV